MRRGAVVICAALLSGCAATVECDVAPPSEAGAPATLSGTGLFCEEAAQIDSRVVAYAPAYRLWSDGMGTRRWIWLPDEGSIDTSDMDHWTFPTGTRLWKEMADEQGPLETRLAERWGPGDGDWTYTTYRWRADGGDADELLIGEPGASVSTCGACHSRLSERVLGFSAIQLTSDAGRSAISALSDRFTEAPNTDTPVLEDDGNRGALGVLHVNCGNCHHDGPRAVATSMQLRLNVGDRTLEETNTYRSTVGMPTDTFDGLATRIVPGDASASALFFRLSSRGDSAQMPPLGTERIDHGGAIAVGTWINELAARGR